MLCNIVSGGHKLYYAPFGTAATAMTSDDYLGSTGEEGIRQNREWLMQEISSDELGPGAIVDGVFQGQNMEIEFVMQEMNTLRAQQFLHPFQQTFTSTAVTGIQQENYGVAGRLACGVVGILKAIPNFHTPAAAFDIGTNNTGATSVYPGTANATVSGRMYKGICIGTMVESLDNTPRFVPVRFRCYPFDDSGVMKMWKFITAIADD